jgi:hypothetical protein
MSLMLCLHLSLPKSTAKIYLRPSKFIFEIFINIYLQMEMSKRDFF